MQILLMARMDCGEGVGAALNIALIGKSCVCLRITDDPDP